MNRERRARLVYLLVLIGGVLLLTAGWYLLTSRPAAGGSYVEGIIGQPQHPSPLFAEGNEADQALAALLFSGLTRIDPDGTPRPDLAERWDISPDGLTYTFHLHPDLFWHDGQPLDARDVAFTVASVQAPGFRGPTTLTARWAGVVVTVPDEQTIAFRLPQASPSFLTTASLGIVPRHLLDSYDASHLFDAPQARTTVGSGPFRLVSLDATHATLAPNPTYQPGAPRLARIELRFYRDEAALAQALRQRRVSGALLGERPSTEALQAVAARSDLRTTPLVEAAYDILYMNNQRDPLTDTALRRALAASIDRQAAIPADDPALPGDGPIVPGTWAYAPGSWSTVAQAEGLFAAAGWSRGPGGALERDGQALHLQLLADDSRAGLASAIAGQLSAQGVAVDLRVMPASELLRDAVQPRAFDLLLFGWQADVDPDPFGGWHTSQAAPGGRNVAGFHDAEADQLLEDARATTDQAQRRDLYARFQARFSDLAPAVVIDYPRRLYVQPRALQGAHPGVLFEPGNRFADVAHWRMGGGG